MGPSRTCYSNARPKRCAPRRKERAQPLQRRLGMAATILLPQPSRRHLAAFTKAARQGETVLVPSGARGRGETPPPLPGRQRRTVTASRQRFGFGRWVFREVLGAMVRKWEKDHFWFYVLALGFKPKAAYSSLVRKKKRLHRGCNTVYAIIVHFLFTKLDNSRAAETFRNCSEPGNFSDVIFRRKCYEWLKAIRNEDKRSSPYFTSSLLISPPGPKLIHLMYWFARHVLIEDMRKNSKGTNIPFAEAVMLKPRSSCMANARWRVACNKVLQIFQREDFIIQEYNNKSQLLIEEIRQIKSEYEVLQIRSCRIKQNDRNKNDKTERIQKVRSMWTHIMEIFTSLKKEKDIVDSELCVLEGCVDQCILDGSNVFRVPELLVRKVESDIHQLCTGQVYVAGKLNFLTVIQLLNEALRTLRDERCKSELKQHFQLIEDKNAFRSKAVQSLEAHRLKREQEHCVSMSGSISRKQKDWKVRWKSFLGLCPFHLMLDQNTELGLLRASPPSSSSSEEDLDSVFCQHLIVPDVCDFISEEYCERDDGTLETMMTESARRRWWSYPTSLKLSEASESRDVLIKKVLHTKIFKEEKTPVPPNILKNRKDESTILEVWDNAGDHVIQTESPVKKEDLLKKTIDEMAEEVARRVMSELSLSPEGERMPLEDTISSLTSNPLKTRKEIPQTSENLFAEIRSSWRKAAQTEGLPDLELAPAEVMLEEAPTDDRPVMQKVADSRLMSSTLASPLPDLAPSVSESKSQLRSTEFRSQEHMRISHIIESSILETSGMQERERTLLSEEQELECIHLNKSFVEDLEEQASQYIKSMNTPDACSENNSRTNVLSDHFWGSLGDQVLPWNVSSLSNPCSCEAGHLKTQTLPEELDDLDTDKSTTSESSFYVVDSTNVTGGSDYKGDIKKSKPEPASKSEEELHQTHNEGEPVSCRSDLSLMLEKRGRDVLCSPPELFCLDEEFTKTPSPVSYSRYCLPSLLMSSEHLKEMVSMVHDLPIDVTHKLKDEKQLNEKLSTKESSSG
ncbi:PREDICTED: HAUS augmin-like complex subunit 6 [Mesitornis unicolor]|nr:PREDICTED: HAUS augmin-like complex subunit 6 [Mesitornis unicolor]